MPNMDRYIFQPSTKFTWLKVGFIVLVCIVWVCAMVYALQDAPPPAQEVSQPETQEFDWRPIPDQTFES